MSGAAEDPRWLEVAGDDRSVQTLSRARTGRTARPVAIVAGLLLACVLATMTLTDADSRPASPRLPDPNGREPPANPASSTAAPDDQPLGPPAGLEALETRFRMIVSPAGGTGNVLLTIDPETGSSVSNLPDLSHLEFDATGDWLAGLSVTTWGERRLVLWAGPAGRSLEPLSFDVSAFAWHDTQPGLIAFSGPGRTSVSFVDLAQNELARSVPLPLDGVVGGWGDWGFAVETSSPTTAIVAPDGTLLHDAIPGSYRGALPDGNLVMSGRRRGVSFAVDPVSGRTDRLDGLRTDAFAWRIVDASGSDRAVAFVSHSALRGDDFRGSIFSIDDDGRLDHVGAVSAFADVDMSAGETITILAPRATGERSTSVDPAIGDEPAIIPLSAGAGWIAAIARP